MALKRSHDQRARTAEGATAARVSRARVGSGIAAARYRLRMSQLQLARRTGLSQAVVSRIEAGERKLGSIELMRIAAVLGVDPAEFLAAATEAKDYRTALRELGNADLQQALEWVPRMFERLDRLERVLR
jgi:transcriptional regulator with XRE-family HTH domain